MDLFSAFDEQEPVGSKKRRKETPVATEDGASEPAASDTSAKRQRPESVKSAPAATKKTAAPAAPAAAPAASAAAQWKSPTQADKENPNPAAAAGTGNVSCLHDVCLPDPTPGQPAYVPDEAIYNPPYPANPARIYPFTLDPFQRMSVGCLERNESVLVAAHTSAGKTVVAEYAIAMSLKRNQRVIYTSPIKALSNQKYRDLYEEFKDVGLMTGDITINPNATCLVMTTEILRSMLYRGSEIMREVAWVIFDEVHYMRDKERGVVWEETIILLPDKVKFVFLSATIPNAAEFAHWVAKIHQQPCHVVYTEYRPTPLQHYIFPAGGDGLHLVVDEKGVFREDNFQKALAALGNVDATRRGTKKGGKGGTSGPSDCFKIVKMIMERNYEPVIVFSFSKKECEAMALQMSKIDLNNEDEKKLVEKVFQNAIDSLSEDDKKLPQVIHILPLLKRGIGIHHSGLLPILKEVIEILFQEGLLKALFSTETFSMGLNMPAKTVVFTSVRKFDGENFRWVSGGEYIQMSGRAGRRGLDDRGIVILMVDEKMEPAVAKGMVQGQADPLNSSFYIGYNMLLNLLRAEHIDPEYMLQRSFHQYQTDRQRPNLERKLELLLKERDLIDVGPDEAAVADYHHVRDQRQKLSDEMREILNLPIHALPFLQPGRLVKVRDGADDWGWGVVVNFQKKVEKGQQQQAGANDAASTSATQYIVDVLLACAPDTAQSPKPRPFVGPMSGEKALDGAAMSVIPALLSLLDGMSTIRIYIPKDLRSPEQRQSVLKSLREIHKRFPDGLPMLDPIKDMKITDAAFKKIVKKAEAVEEKVLQAAAGFSSAETQAYYAAYQRRLEIDLEVKTLRKQLKENENVILKGELKARKRVLRRLGYTNQDDIIELKGRVACDVNAADELLLTELIFGGIFNDLTSEQAVALLGCFVFGEKVDENMRLRDELAGPFRMLQDTARRISKVSAESKLALDETEYLQRFSPYMMDVLFQWAKGAKFSEICAMTDIFEGSIIRCVRRLEELLRQMCSTAKAIGNTELEQRFADGITKIKRDIVFAASLYL
eukprot:TRINITY_DN3360_c0_g2_i1.p1 TRINITY_DN3360_c0_g2~~TRINITY_DN3360_c0_g2_i1.p1  ORF type:complete len:1056 (+),score=481.56 TRINITY_DN3360_c0_g2_i1:1954-5121(+)